MQHKGRVAAFLGFVVLVSVLIVGSSRSFAQNYVTDPYIYMIDHDSNGELHTGETIKVIMKGEKGLKASFSLGDSVLDIPMKEVEPGTYVGEYKQEQRLWIHQEVWVQGKLARGSQWAVAVAGKPVHLKP